MGTEETQSSPNNPEQEEQSGRRYDSRFQVMLQAIVIEATWYEHKNRYADQWNRRPENKLVYPSVI